MQGVKCGSRGVCIPVSGPAPQGAMSAECICVLKIYYALSAECTPDRAHSTKVPSAALHRVCIECVLFIKLSIGTLMTRHF